jgi:hypothetical protein
LFAALRIDDLDAAGVEPARQRLTVEPPVENDRYGVPLQPAIATEEHDEVIAGTLRVEGFQWATFGQSLQ